MKHDEIPGVSAHVDVDGFRLEEFENDQDEEHQNTLVASRYVEAVAGSTFTVGVTFSPDFLYPNNDIVGRLFLDGKDVGGQIARRDRPGSNLNFTGATEITNGATYLRKFQFSDLKTDDGAVKGNMKEELKDLGTISVKLTRCVCRPCTKTAHHISAPEPAGGESVPEKGLKGRAISSRATFGAKEKTKPGRYYDTNFPYGTEPFAVFTFKYRSRKDLQIEGIISRSPSPEPLENRDPATLNADELRQLLARRNQEIQDLANIKREKRERSTTLIDDDEDGDEDELTITGRSSKRQRTSQDSAVEVVDLTDD